MSYSNGFIPGNLTNGINVDRAILALCYFGPSILANGFASSLIHPDTLVYFKKIIWDIGRHPDLKLSADNKGKRGKSKTEANISLHTVHCWHGSMINWNNIDDMHCLPVHFYFFVKAKKCHFCKRWFYWRTRNNEMKKKTPSVELVHSHRMYVRLGHDIPIMCVWTHQHFSSKRMMNLVLFKNWFQWFTYIWTHSSLVFVFSLQIHPSFYLPGFFEWRAYNLHIECNRNKPIQAPDSPQSEIYTWNRFRY